MYLANLYTFLKNGKKNSFAMLFCYETILNKTAYG